MREGETKRGKRRSRTERVEVPSYRAYLQGGKRGFFVAGKKGG